MDGCVNTRNCSGFFAKVDGDGRNQTAKDIFQCFYNADNDFAFVNYDPELTLTLLLIMIFVPPTILILSCTFMLICSARLEVKKQKTKLKI
jgi:hypothetical protein